MLGGRYKLSSGDKLRDYQDRAAHKLFAGEPVRDRLTGEQHQTLRDGTAVHIDMGLGKTIIGLTAIADWFAWRVIDKPVLVVAPIKVCETVWRQEARDWSHTRHLTFSLVRGNERDRAYALAQKAHIFLINPELLVWLHKYLRHDWSVFDALIVDESSMFKDNRSKRFRVITNYGTRVALKDASGVALRDTEGHLIITPPHRFKRSGILTGTPSPQGLLNLWAPFYMIDHGARLHAKYETFQGRFFHKTQQVAAHVHKYEINAEEDEARPEFQAREGSPERIHELVADITVELNAADYGVLPQTIAHEHYVEIPPELRKQYDTLERDALIELQNDVVMAQNGGAKSMMCWQYCNGAIYQTDDFGRKIWHELHPAKLDKLVEVIDLLNANIIVPYYFKHDLERLQARFRKEGMAYSVMSGKGTERTVERWNSGDIPILLLHPQSAGHGLNLQFGGHNILWFTMLWSFERYAQTNARLARSGQRNVVGIHHILARHTTDQLMYLNLGTKGDDQTRFRVALRDYQRLKGLGINTNANSPLEGLGI